MDIYDDLLALAEEPVTAPTRKRKRAGSDASDMQVSSAESSGFNVDSDEEEEEESDSPANNPYPFQGKYKDAADKARLENMTEIDRETILEQRAEEVQRIQDRLALSKMVNTNKASSTRNSTRKVKTTGKTDKKKQSLQELTAKRRVKSQKSTLTRREYRDDDDDPLHTYSNSEDDYQDQESDNDLRKPSKSKATKASKGSSRRQDEVADQDLIRKITMPRVEILEHWAKALFREVAIGAYVRVNLGPDPNGQLVYRLCRIEDTVPVQKGKVYKTVGGDLCDILLKVRMGSAERTIELNEISNGLQVADGSNQQQFTSKEYIWLVNKLEEDNLSLPTKNECQAKYDRLRSLRKGEIGKSPLDLQQVWAKKKELDPSSENVAMRKARLRDALTVAQQNQRGEEAKKISEELRALEAASAVNESVAQPVQKKDAWTIVQERNYRMKQEQERKAALAQQEAMRKLQASGQVKVDPSARVKTAVRIMHDVRAATPDVEGPEFAAPEPVVTSAKQEATVVAARPKLGPSKIQQAAKSLNLDLDDF